MKVTCPECRTGFAVPDSVYQAGRPARCSKCRAVFPLPDPAVVADPVFSVPEPIGEAIHVPDEAVNPRRALSPTKLAAVVLALCICMAGIGWGGYMAYTLLSGKEEPAVEEMPEDQLRRVSNLQLENMQQIYITENEKTGPMVIISGNVRNNSSGPRDMISIQAAIIDDQGKKMLIKQQLCGITLTLLQLQMLSRADIDRSLDNVKEALVNNMNVPPGSSVPFMVVFFMEVKQGFDYEVKLLDARESTGNQLLQTP